MGLFFIIKIHDLGERIMTNFDRAILHDSFPPLDEQSSETPRIPHMTRQSKAKMRTKNNKQQTVLFVLHLRTFSILSLP